MAGDSAMTFAIHPLQSLPQLLPDLAAWHHEQWRRYSPGSSLSKRQRRLREHLSPDPIPQTFVGLCEGDLIGSASLVFYHFGPHSPRLPWLTNVYVHPPWRGQGFGDALVAHAESYVANHGFEMLKLFTVDKKAFYVRRGWQLERQARMSGYEVDIMHLTLSPRDS